MSETLAVSIFARKEMKPQRFYKKPLWNAAFLDIFFKIFVAEVIYITK